MAKKKDKRGGKRPGAGRKKSNDPIVTYSVKITHAQAELLKKWGGGDLSAGLQWLVDAADILIRRVEYERIVP